MGPRRVAVSFLTVVLAGGPLCSLSGAAPPAAAGASPTTRRIRRPRAGADGWLSETMLAELERFSASGEYRALGDRTVEAILARLACGQTQRLTTLNDLVYVLRACRYLPLAEETPGGRKFAKWLVSQRPIARRMFRALAETPSPQRPMERLHELIAANEKTVLAYPDLAVAFATAQPMRLYRKLESPASMLETFAWYTHRKLRFRYDLKKMPYELSRYLANSRLSLKERQWAMAAYSRHKNPARSYFDLRYDYAHFRLGQPKKNAKLPYTLPVLRQAGGVCLDQAYYASEVCKSIGIPAAIVTGAGASGLGHAWVACLKVAPGGKSAVWDVQTGRYRAHRYYSGSAASAVTGRQMHDSEFTLVGAAAQLPLIRREEADAAVLLARLVDLAGRTSVEVKPAALKKLAATYNEQRAKGAPEADTDWIKPVRKLDLELVEDLIGEAIKRNLAHRPAWELIIELRKNDRLPVDHLGRFFDVLVTRTAKEYPEYSCLMAMRIVPTIPTPSRRENVYRRALTLYGWRPDLQGRLLIALGDDYRQQDKKDKALTAYGEAASKSLKVPEVALKATGRAEELLLAANRRDMAIQMYSKLFAKTKREKVASVFREQTSHYRLGKRLVDLLEDAGRTDDARSIRAKIMR